MRKTRFWRTIRRASLLLALVVGLTLPGTPMPTAAPTEQVSPPSWFFAEGSTDAPFDTWFLIENPNDQPATVTFNFQPAGGGTSIVRTFVIAAKSRFSLYANQVLPPMSFSTRIDFDRLVFAERSMYVGFDGHVVTGALPGKVWHFAEGSTNAPFHTWLLLQNPNNQVANAAVTYVIAGGGQQVQNLSLPPNSRTSIFVNGVVPNAGVSMLVGADIPIVAERSMYRFPGNAATAVTGVNAPSLKWFFADGDSRSGRDTWLLLFNPNSTAQSASISMLTEAGGIVNFIQPLGPQSRTSIYLNQVLPNQSFSISLEASAPIVAERAMYGPASEPRWAHATQGADAQSLVWLLPEGSTAPPFTEVITVLNTNIEQTTFLRFEFFLPDGTTVTREFGVGPLRKISLTVNDVVPNAGVATRVSGSRPIVVERTMFLSKLGRVGATNTTGIRFPLF